jgi:hypothetical protein
VVILQPGRILSAARQVEYEPSRNWLQFGVFGAGNEWPAPGTEALSLLYTLYDPLGLTSPLLQTESWDSSILTTYEDLSPPAKIEILVFETLVLHELTHRVDYTHSVHGGAFRVLTVHQASSLTQIWPMLLEAGAQVSGVVSKWDRAELARAGPAAMEHWRTLVGTHRELAEYFEMLPKHRLTSGWPPESSEIVRFALPVGDPLEVATIHFSDGTNDATVVLDSLRHPGHYLRPAGVVEGRALCHAVRHLALRFRDRPVLGLLEIARYLTWAAPPSQAPDYRFLLDVVARHFGVADFDSLVRETSRNGRLDVVDMVAAHAATISWVSMGGLDIGQRLLISLVMYADCYSSEGQIVAPWVLAERLEASISAAADAGAQQWNGIEATLERLIAEMHTLPSATLLPGLDIHTKRMVDEITANLIDRRGRGHVCAAGFPPDGNPIAAYLHREDAADMLDLTNQKWVTAGVDLWFRARRALLGYTSMQIKQQSWESLVADL